MQLNTIRTNDVLYIEAVWEIKQAKHWPYINSGVWPRKSKNSKARMEPKKDQWSVIFNSYFHLLFPCVTACLIHLRQICSLYILPINTCKFRSRLTLMLQTWQLIKKKNCFHFLSGSKRWWYRKECHHLHLPFYH